MDTVGHADRALIFLLLLCSSLENAAFGATIDIAYVVLDPPYPTDLDSFAGLMSAQQEANAANLFGSNLYLNITFVQGISYANSTVNDFYKSYSRNHLLGVGSSYVGFVMSSVGNSEALVLIQQALHVTMPFFGPETVSPFMYQPQSRNVINYKVPVDIESGQILYFSMHSTMHCTYYALLRLNVSDFADFSARVTPGPLTHGLRIVEAVVFPYSDGPNPDFTLPLNRTAIRDAYFANPNDVPNCIVIIGVPANVVDIVEALWEDDRFDRNGTYFLASSYVMQRSFNSSKYGTKAFKNLYLSVSFNDFANASIPSVAAHHNALRAYIATAPSAPLALVGASDTSLLGMEPSHFTYQGYMTARLMIEVLRSVALQGPVTSAAIIGKVYDSIFFEINETILGPYSDHCRQEMTFPCFCNGGARTVYSVRVNGDTGHLEHIPRDHPDGSVSYFTSDLNRCTMDITTMDAPLNLVVPVANSSEDGFAVFIETLRTACEFANNNGQLAGVGKLRLILVTPPANASDLVEWLDRIILRYLPLSLFGSDVSTASCTVPSFLESYRQLALSDPPLTDPALFNSFSLQVLPVIADYIHLHAMFISQRGPSLAAVVVFAETTEQQALAVMSLNTFGIVPTQTVLTTTFSQSSVEGLFASSIGLASGQLVSALVVGMNKTHVLKVLEIFAQAAQSNPRNSVTVFVACDEQYIYDAATTMVLNVPKELSLYIASSIPKWWYGNVTSVVSPTAARTALASAALVTVTRTLQNGHTPEQLIGSIYATKTLLSGRDTLGPFYSAHCDADVILAQSVARLCQCTKGPRVFYAYNFHWNSTNMKSVNASAAFTFTMNTCGVLYMPLKPSAAITFFTTSVIAGIASGGSLTLVGLCLVSIGCVARLLFRNNRDAPKEGNCVTIVFTDIQSSTTLWARLPLLMAKCVAQHHAILRKCLAVHRGYEVKTVGDSFMAAFANTCDAARFALQAQEDLVAADWPEEVNVAYDEMVQLAEEQDQHLHLFHPAGDAQNLYRTLWNGIRVRVGMNTGPCEVVFDEVTKGYDYYGTTVNTAARVESVGHGGQTVISGATYDALVAAEFDFSKVALNMCGSCPLRGLDEDIVLYHILPVSLKMRKFGPLRLNIEKTLVEAVSESQSQHSGSVDTQDQIEHVVERWARRIASSSTSVTAPMIVDRFHIFEQIFSTCPRSYRREVVGALRQHWGIEAGKSRSGVSEKRLYATELVQVLSKSCAAASANQPHHDLRMTGVDDEDCEIRASGQTRSWNRDDSNTFASFETR